MLVVVVLVLCTRLLEVLFFLPFVLVRSAAEVWLMLASVLATSPLGVFVPMAGIVDWACARAPVRIRVASRLRKRFMGVKVGGEKQRVGLSFFYGFAKYFVGSHTLRLR